MALTVLAFAVPIGPAGDAQAQPFGDAREPLLDGGGMAGVAHLDAIETLVLKDANLRFGAVITQVRGDGESSDVVDQRGDLGELGQWFFDVRPPAAAQVTAERVADVVTGTRVHERPSDVRPPQRTAVAAEELRLHVLDIDRDTQALKLGDDLLAAAAARGPCLAQEGLEPVVVEGQEQRQHMQLAPRGPYAELAPRDDADAELRAFVGRIRDAVRRVVIGQRDRRQIRRTGAARDLRRLTLAVRSRRMTV